MKRSTAKGTDKIVEGLSHIGTMFPTALKTLLLTPYTTYVTEDNLATWLLSMHCLEKIHAQGQINTWK